MAAVTINPTQCRALPGCMTRPFNMGETAQVGDLARVASDGDLNLTNASSTANIDGQLVLVVAGARADDDGDIANNERVTGVLIGEVYVGEDADLTPGQTLYADAVAGGLNTVAPANVRAVAQVLTESVIFFNPVTAEPNS